MSENKTIRLEWVMPETLTPNPLNWRLHPEGQRREFDALFSEVGWAGALLFNETTGNLVDGHLRWEELAGKGEPVPVLIGNWTPEQEKLILARLDPISALAETDKEALDQLLHDINTDNETIMQALSDMAAEADLYLDKLAEDLGGNDVFEDEPPVDKAEELQDKWQVRAGDVWTLGQHRVICGDCTDEAVVGRLMGGEVAEMGFTSPPYLDMRDYGGNDLSLDTLLNFVKPMIDNCRFSVVNLGLKFKDGEVIQYWDRYISEFNQYGQKLLAWNVWDKTIGGSIASATNMFLLTHEWLFVFGEKRKRLNRTVPNQLEKYAGRWGKDFLDGLEGKSVRQKDGTMEDTTSKAYTHHQLHSVLQQTPELGHIRKKHPAMYPVGLPYPYIEAMTDKHQIVYDPFLGSGSTLIACEQLSRKCYGIEIEPKYVAVILERWSTLTGQQPSKI